MHRKKHTIYRVQHYPRFQAPTGGLGTYPPHTRGGYCTLGCGRNAFYVLPILSHRILRRCVLRDKDLIKLMIFIGSSRTFLVKLAFSFPAMLAGEGCHDSGCGLMPPPRSVLRQQHF